MDTFSCTLFDGEGTIEWFRPRISTRNVASVFPDRPRYILIDTSAGNVMIAPERDGFFVDLEAKHIYLVPEVRPPSQDSSLNSPPSAATLLAAEKALSSSMNALPAMPVPSRDSGTSSVSSSPQQGSKGTLKGFKFKDAKEKMMRKKTISANSNDNLKVNKMQHRKSTAGIPISAKEDFSSRRRSSSHSGGNLEGKEKDLNNLDLGELEGKVCLIVVKDTMAMGPFSTDLLSGEIHQVYRIDADGNVEIYFREKPHLVRFDCVQILPLENPTLEQQKLILEMQQFAKDKKKLLSGGSFRRTSTAQRSMLTQIRTRMGKGDGGAGGDLSSSAESDLAVSPRSSAALRTSSGSYMPPNLNVENLDEQLNPASVFGKPLALNDSPIPGPVRKCIEFFRRNNGRHIKYEGIFRVPGSSNAVMRIKNKFLISQTSDYEIPEDENPTVVASALKTFLFELPDPLIPVDQWYTLMEITDNRDFELNDAHNLLDELPEEHFELLRYVMDFLADVAEDADYNKMSHANLGMVFGIVLIQPPDQNVTNVGSSMPKEVCTFLVEHYDDVFEEPESE